MDINNLEQDLFKTQKFGGLSSLNLLTRNLDLKNLAAGLEEQQETEGEYDADELDGGDKSSNKDVMLDEIQVMDASHLEKKKQGTGLNALLSNFGVKGSLVMGQKGGLSSLGLQGLDGFEDLNDGDLD